MKDRRSVRTDKAIREAFLTLLVNKSVNNITVTEISELADIGRGTFYLHYKDPYDLLERIEDEVVDGIEKSIQQPYSENSEAGLMECVEKSAEYMNRYTDLCKALLSSKEYAQFMGKLVRLFTRLISPKVEQQEFQRFHTAFLVSGAIGMLIAWITSDVEMVPKEVARTVADIFEHIGKPVGL